MSNRQALKWPSPTPKSPTLRLLKKKKGSGRWAARCPLLQLDKRSERSAIAIMGLEISAPKAGRAHTACAQRPHRLLPPTRQGPNCSFLLVVGHRQHKVHRPRGPGFSLYRLYCNSVAAVALIDYRNRPRSLRNVIWRFYSVPNDREKVSVVL